MKQPPSKHLVLDVLLYTKLSTSLPFLEPALGSNPDYHMHLGGSSEEQKTGWFRQSSEDRLVVLSLHHPGGSPEEIQDEQYLHAHSKGRLSREGGPSGRGLSYKPL